MSTKKKLLIAIAGLLFAAIATAAVFYAIYGRDHYDPSKYDSQISDGLAIGSTINFTMPDQFDVSHTIGPETTTMIAVSGRAQTRAAKEYVDKQPADFLAKRNAMLVIDISAAPTVVRNKFMLPKLKESSYPIVLIYEKAIAASLTKPDTIAVVSLENNVVKSVAYVKTDAELASALP